QTNAGESMAKELFISSTPHETKVAVVEDEQLAEIYFERENEYTLAGSIYKGRVTRVLPGMQSAFVDIGLERDAFLYVTDFLEEQEDQEDFEHVVTRAHSDAHQQSYSTQAQPAAERRGEVEAEPGPSEQPAPSEGQFERTPRKWRGRRGRRRGRGEFQEHSASSSQPNAEPMESNEAEPVLLPGESLSKYRGSEHAETQPAAQRHEDHSAQEKFSSLQPARSSSPSPITPEAEGFAVLPGESLSKYRNRGESETAPALTVSEPRRDFRQERSQREQRPRWEAPPTGPAVATLPGESLAKYRNRPAAVSEEVTSERAPQSDVVPTAPAGPFVSPAEQQATEFSQEAGEAPGTTTRGTQFISELQPEPESRFEAADVAQSDSEQPSVETVDSDSEPQSDATPHQFGSGVLEEEIIDEEESENH